VKLKAALLVSVAIAAPALTFAQDRTPAPAKKSDKILCGFCGASRDTGETCTFCGGRSEGPSSEKPAADPSGEKEFKDLPKVAPAPELRDAPKDPRGVERKDASAKEQPLKDSSGGPGDDDIDEKARRAYQDDNMAKGDYYFKTGYYLKASEAYRVAVLAEPVNPWKKLAFGHSLFAIGNYSYSSYALRRAVSQLDSKNSFNPDVSSLFPSKKAFEKAVKDLKRYVTYSPRDPAGLSVLGYMLFAQGEDDRAKEMFVYLQRLPKNENDPFAAFFLKQIESRKGEGDKKAPELTAPKPVDPPKVTPPPPTAQPSVATPEGIREGEEKAKATKTAPAKALAE
jgi:tetratricopeptide (TPR) repeat protein